MSAYVVDFLLECEPVEAGQGKAQEQADSPFEDKISIAESSRYFRCGSACRGWVGYFVVSDGSTQPYRVRVRPPSFVNLQALDKMVRGSLVADVVAVIGTLDIVLGEVDR